jgi:hypothetical protein
VPLREKEVKFTYIIGGTTYNAVDDGAGVITGTHITTGSVDYLSGDINITFDTAIDNGADVVCDYIKKCIAWSSNVATIELQEQVPYNFVVADTFAGVCISIGDLIPSISDVIITSASGTFDDTKATVNNAGTEYDTFTIEFTDATNFNVTGARLGVLSAGDINSTYSPTNPKTSQPYFTIDVSAWGGTWAASDTVVFTTNPAHKAVWWKEVVPAGTSREPNNIVTAEWFVE